MKLSKWIALGTLALTGFSACKQEKSAETVLTGCNVETRFTEELPGQIDNYAYAENQILELTASDVDNILRNNYEVEKQDPNGNIEYTYTSSENAFCLDGGAGGPASHDRKITYSTGFSSTNNTTTTIDAREGVTLSEIAEELEQNLEGSQFNVTADIDRVKAALTAEGVTFSEIEDGDLPVIHVTETPGSYKSIKVTGH